VRQHRKELILATATLAQSFGCITDFGDIFDRNEDERGSLHIGGDPASVQTQQPAASGGQSADYFEIGARLALRQHLQQLRTQRLRIPFNITNPGTAVLSRPPERSSKNE